MVIRRLLEHREAGGYLDGQMLVAMPGMQDQRFARSVIYLCAHSGEGAMGIVVNRKASNIGFRELMVQLKVIGDNRSILLPPRTEDVQVLSGGPVEKGRGFVLHSRDFFIENSSLPIDDGVALTITMDILKAIAAGKGPQKAIVALGYAGWSAGQLEREIQDNGWLHCPADPTLIFDADHDSKYERAMKSIGIDPRMLSSEAGHA